MRMAMIEVANDSLSVVGIRDSCVIVYSWTVDHAVGLLFAMEEVAW